MGRAQEPGARERRAFTAEFEREAVRRANERRANERRAAGVPLPYVARELGVTARTRRT